jgi:hypothetical protein
VSIHANGAVIPLRVGTSIRLEDGVPQAAVHAAGHVSAQIPKGVVQRQAQGPEITLNPNEEIDWNDVVRTLQAGRVRIALLDGSFLNIGARSMMRIVQHDPQTQQTQIELTLGHLRGEVKKLTAPGASFQVRTPTAVIGVVGTIFVADAQNTLSRVCSVEGEVSVRNINPAVAGQVVLHPGECTTVSAGEAPTPPVMAAQDVSTLMDQTTLPSRAAKGAAVRPMGTAARGLPVLPVAADATAAVLAGVAVSRSGDANSVAQQANSTAGSAESAAKGAAGSASDALNSALGALGNVNSLNQAINNFSNGLEVSPSKPCPNCP